MIYILIGGTGFLGRAFKDYLLANQCKVAVIGRAASPVDLEGVSYFSVGECHFEEADQLIETNEDCVIIDFAYASIPQTSFEDPIKDFSINLYNVVKHLEFARRINTKRYIYISSGGTVYGNVNQPKIKEDAPNFPISPYGITKMACERYVNMYHSIYGLNACIVRPSNVYGPGQQPYRGQGFVATALAQAYKGESINVFGHKNVTRDYLYADDFCRALQTVVTHGQDGEIYNLSFGEGNSISGVIDVINGILKKEGLQLNVRYGEERPYDVASNVLDNRKLSALSDWKPKINLEEGVSDTWNWMKKYLSRKSH